MILDLLYVKLWHIEVNHDTAIEDVSKCTTDCKLFTYPAISPFLSFWTDSLNLLRPTTVGSSRSLPICGQLRRSNQSNGWIYL